MNTPLVTMAVLGALGGLMMGVRALQARECVGAEAGRKLVHVGMGLVCLPFPWLFPEPGPVWLLGGLATVVLLAVRMVPALAHRYGGVLGGVRRSTWGDLAFPLGLVLAFAFAHDRPTAFCAAVGVLTFGDTAGALVGNRWGRRRYPVFGGEKSLEGSIAVGLVSGICLAAAAGALGHAPWLVAATAGLVIGTAAMVVESIFPLGLDNLTLPPTVAGLVLLWEREPNGPSFCFWITGAATVVWVVAVSILLRRHPNRQPPSPANARLKPC